jgi:hypothetical protein
MNVAAGSGEPSGRRRVASIAMVVVAVIATAATQPPRGTDLKSSVGNETINLDADHPLVSQRFAVAVPPEAATGHALESAGVVLDNVSAFGLNGKLLVAAEAIHVRVVAIDAAASNGHSPLPGDPLNRPVEWQANLRSGNEVGVQLDCQYGRPCERVFRLIATLDTSVASRGAIRWHVETALYYEAGPYPSGVAMSVRIDDAITPPGLPPQLDVSLPAEQVRLSAVRPAVARLVEVRLAAADIGPDGPPRTSLEAYAVTGASATRSAAAIVSMRTVAKPIDANTGIRGLLGSSSEQVNDNADLFAGCEAGVDCVRTLLLGIQWDGGAEADFTWQLTVHRLDFERAYAAPRDAIQVRLLDGIDAGGKPSTLHFEGVERFAAPGASFAPIRTAISVRTRIAIPGVPPAYAALLPVAGSARLHLLPDARAGERSVIVGLRPGNRYEGPGLVKAYSERVDGTGNPFLFCVLGSECPVWHIDATTAGSASEPDPEEIRWVLDVEVYSYPDLPVVVEGSPNP